MKRIDWLIPIAVTGLIVSIFFSAVAWGAGHSGSIWLTTPATETNPSGVITTLYTHLAHPRVVQAADGLSLTVVVDRCKLNAESKLVCSGDLGVAVRDDPATLAVDEYLKFIDDLFLSPGGLTGLAAQGARRFFLNTYVMAHGYPGSIVP